MKKAASLPEPLPAYPHGELANERTCADALTAAYEVRGELDISLLQTCLRDLVERHEMLRMAFVGDECRLDPLLTLDALPAVAEADLTSLSAARQLSALPPLCSDHARRPFNLLCAPLLRLLLIHLAPNHHHLLLCAHQLVADPASLHLLAAELSLAYAARASGQTPHLPPLRATFEQFAAHQRAWLETPAASTASAFWAQRLRALPLLRLPTDHPRPAVKAASLCGGHRRLALPVPLAKRLRTTTGGDPLPLLLAAWAALLGRCSSQSDFAIGLPLANRQDGPWEGVVGPCENTLVLRAELGDDPSFAELVRRTECGWQAARAHQRMPLERLIQLSSEAEVTHSPLFQVQFVVSDECRSWRAGQLRWQPTAVETGLSAFDLTLRVAVADPAAGWLEVEYDTQLFEARTAERLLEQLVVLVEAALEDAQQRVSQLPVLSAAQRQQVVVEWNQTAAAYPRQQCLHELIAEQARRTPEVVAITAADGQLSYRELNERANAVAHRLRGLGVGPEVLVGVAGERKAATIVGLLGVLKAGGAYVPLEVEYPRARLEFMLADGEIKVVVAEAAVAGRLPLSGQEVVDPAAEVEGSREEPESGVGAENLAYVIYTSGSTGQAKGVLIGHRQIVNSTIARWAFGRFSPGSYAMPAPLSFDASCAGIYWTLCTGGRLVLPSSEQAQDPRLLARLIKDERITHVTGMPWFYMVLLAAGREALRSLRDISVGGETAPLQLPSEHYNLLPWARLYNDYGPTEATVWASAYLCHPTDSHASVPIGRPIQNTQLYLLDPHLNPLPIGSPGELFIGGDGLARGYLKRPALTAERFIPNPFATQPGERLYRTGDLARWLEDGNLEFLGRLDTQVKVRGFRVELGEIEAVLQGHEAVAAAAVVARAERAGDTRLAAYVVLRAGCEVTVGELKEWVGRQLPGYMIPTWISFLEQLPQSAHGKIDRHALLRIKATEPHVAVEARDNNHSQPEPEDAHQLVNMLSDPEVDSLLRGMLQPGATN